MRKIIVRNKIVLGGVFTVLAFVVIMLNGGNIKSALASGYSVKKYQPEELNEGGLKDIATLSLPEAKKRLNYLITDTRETLESYKDLAGIAFKFSVSSIPLEPDNQRELQYAEPIHPVITRDVKVALGAITPGEIILSQEISLPGASIIRWQSEELDAFWGKSRKGNSGLSADYTLTFKRIFFRDGTEKNCTELNVQKLEPSNNGHNQDLCKADRGELNIATAKPVERMTFDVNFRSSPAFRKVVLDKDHPKVTLEKGEIYQLTSLKDGSASFQVSTSKVVDFDVQGISSSGKPLLNTGSSSNSMPSDAGIAALQNFYIELLKTSDEFSQFNNSQGLYHHLQKLESSFFSAQSHLKQQQVEYYFEATPVSIDIFVYDPVEESTIEMEMSAARPYRDVYIAYDKKTDLEGLVDISGNWKVNPTYDEIRYSDTAGLYVVKVGEEIISEGFVKLVLKYFYLPPGSNDLKSLPFDNIIRIINDEIVLVQRETNGPYGLYDLKKHVFIIPMKFVHPNIKNDVFIARQGEKTHKAEGAYGAYNLKGKEILAPKYSEIEYVDEYLYTKSADRSYRDVFDLKGKKINPADYNVIGIFSDDQPVLLQSYKENKFAFMNKQGVILPFKLDYDKVNPFSEGVAVVTKGTMSGAIDLQGNLKIPLSE